MKNEKLDLKELKVKSFVTDLDKGGKNTVKGGLHDSVGFTECNVQEPTKGFCTHVQNCE